MNRLLGSGFRFVATEPIHQERTDMGYADMNVAYPFAVRSYESKDALGEALRLGTQSDIVVIGSAPEQFVTGRLTANKLTFRYSEHLFKKGRWRIVSPKALKFLLWNNLRFKNKRLYLLCASAYTAGDFAIVGAYQNKAYKWGYFTEVKQHDLNALMVDKQKDRLCLLWAGRFLDWKHPDKALHVARRLRDEGVNFVLKIIGRGGLEGRLKTMADSFGMKDCVEFLGSMPPDAVRKHMEAADIYLFSSDYNEGWGVVLNEAMNSGCAVVASHAPGSVPFLIKNGENGLTYQNDSLDDLCGKVLFLAKDPELRARLGNNAYHTMSEQWNARVAAERLLKLSECLLVGKDAATLYIDGPCSVAKPTSQEKMYEGL